MDESRDLMRGATRLRFPGELESRFRDDYYRNSIALCRAALVASLAMWMAFGWLDPLAIPSAMRQVWFIRFVLVTPFYGALAGLSFLPLARRAIQTATSLGLLIVGLGLIAMTRLARPDELGFIFYPLGLLLEAMVGYSFLRLRFWHATLPNLLLLAIYAASAISEQGILNLPQGREIFLHNGFFLLTANLAGIGTCYSLELYARRAFVSNYLLDLERAGERRQREQTESMLQVLSQAIGGVVHDLGTPLTSVQVGAQTLKNFVEQGYGTPDDLATLIGIILNGAEMLNYQRLSLMEQTRVLQGQPIPLDLRPTSMPELVKSALRFHTEQLVGQRRLSFAGDDLQLDVDPRKMTTVLMNLIGNALKYSDGEVQVFWRAHDDRVLLAVADQGKKGAGLSRAQAEQLFVAFGRLDQHTKIEGTGLGLLSVRRIVEAHGGEVFIEGTDFSTAQNPYPRLLEPPFRSAFVIACPRQTIPSPNE